jgi:hypothetical protein
MQSVSRLVTEVGLSSEILQIHSLSQVLDKVGLLPRRGQVPLAAPIAQYM